MPTVESYALCIQKFCEVAASSHPGNAVFIANLCSCLRMDFIEQSNIGKYYGCATDNQENPTKRIMVDGFDFRVDSWYKDAVKAGRLLWSEIYTWNDDLHH